MVFFERKSISKKIFPGIFNGKKPPLPWPWFSFKTETAHLIFSTSILFINKKMLMKPRALFTYKKWT